MDVTEEAQARATLQQQSKREMASHLTSGLAHDFSNLLTIILGAQGRLAKLDLPPDARQLVDATLNAATRGGAYCTPLPIWWAIAPPSTRHHHCRGF